MDIFENEYYRLVEQVNETTMTWYNGDESDQVAPIQISFKQPTSVNVDDAVFVLIKSNDLAEYDNHYLAGIVVQDNEDDTYEIEYAAGIKFPSGGGSTLTTQHIEFLYMRLDSPNDPFVLGDFEDPQEETSTTEILSVGLYGNRYRAIQKLGDMTGSDGYSYNATFFDDTEGVTSNICQLLQRNESDSWETGDPVFVLVESNDNTDNYYLRGLIDKVYTADNTYDIIYRADIDDETMAERRQPAAKLYSEYFKFDYLNVGIFENKYYRVIGKIIEVEANTQSLKVTWPDDKEGTAINPMKIKSIQPLNVSLHQIVFVKIKDGNALDNHYLLGQVVGVNLATNHYEFSYSYPTMAENPEGHGEVPTKQHISRIYLPTP